MTVYCLIPVHNRIDATKGVLRALERQSFQNIVTIVIDDGSTDGTREYIRLYHPRVIVIEGDGSLWWTGAIAKGLKHILSFANNEDYVLLQNNDTSFAENYVSELVRVSKRYPCAVVGSPLRDISSPENIISIGPEVNYLKVRIEDVWKKMDANDKKKLLASLPEVIKLDALSGRGTLYPVDLIRKIGLVRYKLLPHYWADYEFSVRAKKAGAKLLVAMHAPVLSETSISGIRGTDSSIVQTLFSRKSQSNIIHTIVFYTLSGPWILRVTSVVRIVLLGMWGKMKRIGNNLTKKTMDNK